MQTTNNAKITLLSHDAIKVIQGDEKVTLTLPHVNNGDARINSARMHIISDMVFYLDESGEMYAAFKCGIDGCKDVSYEYNVICSTLGDRYSGVFHEIFRPIGQSEIVVDEYLINVVSSTCLRVSKVGVPKVTQLSGHFVIDAVNRRIILLNSSEDGAKTEIWLLGEELLQGPLNDLNIISHGEHFILPQVCNRHYLINPQTMTVEFCSIKGHTVTGAIQLI
jgi:hypothetical protein